MKRNTATWNTRGESAARSISLQNKFSLIELLITITIILILASLLLPALNAAKRKAQAISCASQLKTVSESSHLYANDHNDIIPQTIPISGDYDNYIRLFAVPEPEYGFTLSSVQFSRSRKYFSFKILRCPENRSIPPNEFSGAKHLYYFYGVYGIYAPQYGSTSSGLSDKFIASYGSCHTRILVASGVSLSFFQVNRMKNNSALPIFADTVVGLSGKKGYRSGYSMFWGSESAGIVDGISLSRQHPGGRCSMAFADGHVSSLDANGLAKLPVPFRHSWGEGLRQTVLPAN